MTPAGSGTGGHLEAWAKGHETDGLRVVPSLPLQALPWLGSDSPSLGQYTRTETHPSARSMLGFGEALRDMADGAPPPQPHRYRRSIFNTVPIKKQG